MNLYFGCLRKYIDFSGRARRMEFWMFHLVNLAIAFILQLTAAASPTDGVAEFVTVSFVLVMLLPGVAVLVRRLQDTGRSGWWLLLVAVPLLGTLTLWFFTFLDSQPGPNKYGPNPKKVTG